MKLKPSDDPEYGRNSDLVIQKIYEHIDAISIGMEVDKNFLKKDIERLEDMIDNMQIEIDENKNEIKRLEKEIEDLKNELEEVEE